MMSKPLKLSKCLIMTKLNKTISKLHKTNLLLLKIKKMVLLKTISKSLRKMTSPTRIVKICNSMQKLFLGKSVQNIWRARDSGQLYFVIISHEIKMNEEFYSRVVWQRILFQKATVREKYISQPYPSPDITSLG